MHVINVRNVNSALPEGIRHLRNTGIKTTSRNGGVVVAQTPVTTVYRRPTERVLFEEKRDANPFFHFMEGLWMLAGRNDVAWISQFNASFKQFSDDEETFHGAYGYRWRTFFGMDQIEEAISVLKQNHDDRRCVIQMWDADNDLNKVGKDFPCNTQIYLSILGGFLNMTVCCRSNDIIWGAYGANAVHFSMFMEYMAAAIGVKVGTYYQMSNNFHAYNDLFDKMLFLADHTDDGFAKRLQVYDSVVPFPMVNSPMEVWDADLRMFIEEGSVLGFRDPFFRRVALPMYRAWFIYKDIENPYRFDHAIDEMETCIAEDWKLACVRWLGRRKEAAKRKAENAGK